MSNKFIPSIIIAILCELCPTEGNNFYEEDLKDWEEVMAMFRRFLGNRKSISYTDLRKFCIENDVCVYQFNGPCVDVGCLLLNKLQMFK